MWQKTQQNIGNFNRVVSVPKLTYIKILADFEILYFK